LAKILIPFSTKPIKLLDKIKHENDADLDLFESERSSNSEEE